MSSLQGEDLLAFVTRLSPKPPDMVTLLWALSGLAVGMLMVFLWVRRRGQRVQVRHLLPAMVVGSLLWSGLFCFRELVPHFFEPPYSSSRESFDNDTRTGFDALLWEIRETVPREGGILLINCGSPRQVEWTQYILYPRRIFLEKYSTAAVKDPIAFLTPENKKLLTEKGIEWAMDLAPAAVREGAGKSLITIHREDEK